MNIFRIDENKVLTLATESKWYVGEGDFEHIQVIMSPEVSGNDMSEWLSSIKLCVVRDAMKWYRTLTFTLDDDGNYTSDMIDVDGAWCLKEGEVLFFVQFEKDSDLGVTNQVCVEIYPSEDTDVLYDGFATENWVADYVGENTPTVDTESLTNDDGCVPSSALMTTLLDDIDTELNKKVDSLTCAGQIIGFTGSGSSPNSLIANLTYEAMQSLGVLEEEYSFLPSSSANDFEGMFFINGCSSAINIVYGSYSNRKNFIVRTGDFFGVIDGEWTKLGHLDIVTAINGCSGNVELEIPTVATSESTTEGEVYDVTYINSIIGDIESLLSEV